MPDKKQGKDSYAKDTMAFSAPKEPVRKNSNYADGRLQQRYPQGQIPQGQRMQGYPPQGQYPQGQIPQGQRMQGYPPQGQYPQGQMPQGQRMQGYPPQGQIPQRQRPQGGILVRDRRSNVHCNKEQVLSRRIIISSVKRKNHAKKWDSFQNF